LRSGAGLVDGSGLSGLSGLSGEMATVICVNLRPSAVVLSFFASIRVRSRLEFAGEVVGGDVHFVGEIEAVGLEALDSGIEDERGAALILGVFVEPFD
jgi:hypothetical protein